MAAPLADYACSAEALLRLHGVRPLLVEDNADLREMAAEGLEMEGPRCPRRQWQLRLRENSSMSVLM